MKRKRLKALVKEIKADPSRHNNKDWIVGLANRQATFDESLGDYIPQRVKEFPEQVINCGTSGCIAGLAALRYAPVGTQFWRNAIRLPDAEFDTNYEQYGKEVLGCSEEEASYLFNGTRTFKEIKRFAKLSKEQQKEFIGGYYD